MERSRIDHTEYAVFRKKSRTKTFLYQVQPGVLSIILVTERLRKRFCFVLNFVFFALRLPKKLHLPTFQTFELLRYEQNNSYLKNKTLKQLFEDIYSSPFLDRPNS